MSPFARIFSAAVLLAGVACSPTLVDRVTIVNPHEYLVSVYVSDGSSPTSAYLGEIDRESEETLEDIFDWGNRWSFRFSFRDFEGQTVVLSRAELEAAGWRVSVPEDLAERLRQRGEPPSHKGS